MVKRLESLAHFLLLGVAAAYCLTGPVALLLFVVREFTDWTWTPWPYQGQWGPGDLVQASLRVDEAIGRGVEESWRPADRVEDLRRDSIETCLGIAVGTGLSMAWPWWGFH